MNPISEASATDESQTIEANRAQASAQLLQQPRQKSNSIFQPLFHAKLHALVQRDDAAGLENAMEDLRKDWNSESIAKMLWYLALLEGKPRTFEVLCQKSREKAFKFSLNVAMDEMPEALQMWALDIPVARNMWLSEAEPLSAKGGYRLVQGLRFLENNPSVQTLRETLDAKPDAFHARMRLFIADFSMPTLMKNGAFLHTIAYYQEPSKKHLRVAATGTNPVYDIDRMETHWPGIGAAMLALTGLGLSVPDCQERVRKIISNKHAAAEPKYDGVDLPVDFSMGS